MVVYEWKKASFKVVTVLKICNESKLKLDLN